MRSPSARLSFAAAGARSTLVMVEETVSRILIRFHEEGLISTRHKNVSLIDMVRLEAIARNKDKTKQQR